MQPGNDEGVEDMATLTELHSGSIMHNLHQRYTRDRIYVSATSRLWEIPRVTPDVSIFVFDFFYFLNFQLRLTSVDIQY